MSDVTTVEKTLGEQMWDLLERNPENYDVTFSVGLEKKEVKAVKFLLKAASRVFQKEFEDNWEKALMKDGEGIPLKDVDPRAFELAVQLLIQDKWSLEVLKSLNLSPNILLSLLGICRPFEITKAIKNLEEVADEFLRSFNEFKDTDDFLKLTQSNLAALFSCESMPVEEKDIYDCACRWAEYQCSQKGLELTVENMREALGPCLFEIRFPVMSISDFTKAGRSKNNLLKPEEKLAIFEFIGLDESERIQISNGRIELHGIGFVEPVLADAYYDITIDTRKWANSVWSSVTEKMSKRVFARKQEIFYVIFDAPVVLEPIKDESTFNISNHYQIDFTLKGPDTMAVDRKLGSEESLEEGGIKFRFYWDSGRTQFAEYLYKKL